MHLKRVTDPSHPMYDKALALYRMSFPFHEQREAISQNKILEDDEYHFELIYDEETFVGLVLYWKNEKFVYVEHFCILPEMRNKKYGEKTLAALSAQGIPLILEIDPPVDGVSKRRKGFYERCGFCENSLSHVHPPYHRENAGHDLMLMTCPAQISREMFEAFSRYLKSRVMNDAFD